MTEPRCDRCKALIGADHVTLFVNLGADPLNWPEDVNSGRPNLELCPGCLNLLTAVLRDPDVMLGFNDGELAERLERFADRFGQQLEADDES